MEKRGSARRSLPGRELLQVTRGQISLRELNFFLWKAAGHIGMIGRKSTMDRFEFTLWILRPALLKSSSSSSNCHAQIPIRDPRSGSTQVFFALWTPHTFQKLGSFFFWWKFLSELQERRTGGRLHIDILFSFSFSVLSRASVTNPVEGQCVRLTAPDRGLWAFQIESFHTSQCLFFG